MRLCVLEALHDLKEPSKKAEFEKVLAEMKEIDDRYKGSYESTYTQFILKDENGVNDPTKGPLGEIKKRSDACNERSERIFEGEWARLQERQRMFDAEAIPALQKLEDEEARMRDLQRRFEAGDPTMTAAEQKELEAYLQVAHAPPTSSLPTCTLTASRPSVHHARLTAWLCGVHHLQDRCYVTVRPDRLAAGKVTFCQKTRDASELYFHAAVVRQKVRDAARVCLRPPLPAHALP